MADWQPIETAPKDNTDILLWNGRFVSVGRWNICEFYTRAQPYWATERGYMFGVQYDRACQPTHWMPLPEPPKVTP